jgi:hypothetical protein
LHKLQTGPRPRSAVRGVVWGFLLGGLRPSGRSHGAFVHSWLLKSALAAAGVAPLGLEQAAPGLRVRIPPGLGGQLA